MDFEKIKQRSIERANDPQPGDYWSEMCSPICVVVHRLKNTVIICKERVGVDDTHWTWDLDKTEAMRVDEFKQWLSYKSMPDKLYAECMGKHDWVVEECKYG